MTSPDQNQGIKIDPEIAMQTLANQRNEALDKAAQWETVAQMLAAENASMRDALASIAAAGETEPEGDESA